MPATAARVPECGDGHEAEFVVLPGQDHRHRARPGEGPPCLVSLRRMRARPGAPRRRARHSRRRCRRAWRKMIARAGGRGAVRQGRRPARRPGRDHADRQATERSAEADGAAAAAGHQRGGRRDRRPHGWSRCRPPALPDKLYVAVDGTGVPVSPAEAEGRAGKATTARPAPARSSWPALFTQTRLDEDGEPGPGPVLLHLPGHLPARRRRSASCWTPRPAAAASSTSASSSSSATAPPGSAIPTSG